MYTPVRYGIIIIHRAETIVFDVPRTFHVGTEHRYL